MTRAVLCRYCHEKLVSDGSFCQYCGNVRPLEAHLDERTREFLLGGDVPDIPTWPAKVIWATIVMLLWALLPFNPYSYFVLLRWVVCAVLGWQARAAKRNGMYAWMILFGVGSVVYNPLVAFHFSRMTWSAINIATVIALLALPFAYVRRLTPP